MDPVRQALLSKFKGDEKLRFLAIVLRVARADGVSALERNQLQPVAGWMSLGSEEQATAIRMADNPDYTMEELVAGFQHDDKGLWLFRECCGVVWVDMTKSADEEALLAELVRVLGISEDIREVLDSPISSFPEGERRFLTLLGGT